MEAVLGEFGGKKRAEESLGARLGEDVGAVEVVKSVEREERRKERRLRES